MPSSCFITLLPVFQPPLLGGRIDIVEPAVVGRRAVRRAAIAPRPFGAVDVLEAGIRARGRGGDRRGAGRRQPQQAHGQCQCGQA
jgi:hypothetical protein